MTIQAGGALSIGRRAMLQTAGAVESNDARIQQLAEGASAISEGSGWPSGQDIAQSLGRQQMAMGSDIRYLAEAFTGEPMGSGRLRLAADQVEAKAAEFLSGLPVDRARPVERG